MKKRVRGHLPKLEPVVEEEVSEEFMRRKGNATKQVCQEYNGKTRWRIRTNCRTWRYDGGWIIGDQSQLDSAVFITCADSRLDPIPLRLFRGGGARSPWCKRRLSTAYSRA